MSDKKRVVVEVTFTMLREYPADWDEEMVNFHLNDSSHCLATEIQELMEEEARAEEGCCFTCHRASGKFLRAATPEDIKSLTPPKPAEAKVCA